MEQNEQHQPAKVLPIGTGTNGASSDTTTVQTEPEQATTSTTTEPVAPVIKKPIFIASAEYQILEAIKQALFVDTSKDDVGNEVPVLSDNQYELQILSPEIFKQLNSNYLFGLMNEEEQKRQQEILQSDRVKQQATQQAIQLHEWILDVRVKAKNALYKITDPTVFMFYESELKALLLKVGKKLSHQQVWTLLDLLSLHGFVQLVNLDHRTLQKEKRLYKLVLNDDEQFKMLVQKCDGYGEMAEWYKQQQAIYNTAAQKLADKIEADKLASGQQILNEHAEQQSATDTEGITTEDTAQ
jgi:hypothetical protein